MAFRSDKTTDKILRASSAVSGKHKFTSALIVAAGSSSRMNNPNCTKQMTLLDGIPVVVRTLLAYEASDSIDEIVVAAKPDEMPLYSIFKRKYSLGKLTAVVAGGSTRQESVLAALEASSPKAKFFAIADAARCLIEANDIDKVCRVAYKTGAATAATRAVDTVKISDSPSVLSNISSTPERSCTWLAQTPQVFGANIYRAAAYSAKDESFTGTDDNSLVERIKYPVCLVECDRCNIKITTPDDLLYARLIIAKRKKAAKKEGQKTK